MKKVSQTKNIHMAKYLLNLRACRQGDDLTRPYSQTTERGVRAQPPRCDLWGAQPRSSVNCLQIRTENDHYSALESIFRFEKLSKNC